MKHMRACDVVGLELGAGVLGVRELKKAEIDRELDLVHCSGVIEASWTESKRLLRASMQCIH
jgi:hypothetical protein